MVGGAERFDSIGESAKRGGAGGFTETVARGGDFEGSRRRRGWARSAGTQFGRIWTELLLGPRAAVWGKLARRRAELGRRRDFRNNQRWCFLESGSFGRKERIGH